MQSHTAVIEVSDPATTAGALIQGEGTGPLNDLTEACAIDARAVDACRRAKAKLRDGDGRLRCVIEAGRLLLSIGRTPGVRTSSSSLTRLQVVTEAAGVSRQAANFWMHAAKTADARPSVLEAYLAAAHAEHEDVTVAGFLRWAAGPRQPDAAGGEANEGDDGVAGCSQFDATVPEEDRRTIRCPLCKGFITPEDL